MQNIDHIRDVSGLAHYITPGGPDDDQKYPSNDPVQIDRQLTRYFDSKYTPNQLKDLVETAFNENFDKDNNGDIDITEFTNSLQNLGFSGDITRIQKLFKLISSTDGDSSSPYIDKENFSDFLLQNYDNKPRLQQYKEELLKAISPKFKDKNTVSVPPLFPSDSEINDMQQTLERMVKKELTHIEADSLFQEELLLHKTNTKNSTFCDEKNALNWDKYEVAYWVGNILGYSYCMKRFFDEKIYGNILLFDVDALMLQKHLSLKVIHLNSFLRRLKSLKRIALKDMYDAENNKKKEKQKKERTLSLDFNTVHSVHIVSETKYKSEEKRNKIQQIQLEATKKESKLINDISILNKEITSLTKDKLSLMQQINDLRGYEHDMIGLKEEIEQMKEENITDKEKQVMMEEIKLLRKRNETLKGMNKELRLKNKALEFVNITEKPDNCYKLEIEKLKSKLRTKEMQNDILERKLMEYKSLSVETIDNYDRAQLQESPSMTQIIHIAKEVMEPPSPNKKQLPIKYKPLPNQFKAKEMATKKSAMDHDQELNDDDDDDDGMIIYDSDNTPQY